MGGLVRFLLGGMLGAVLGFLLSRSRMGTPARVPLYPGGDRPLATAEPGPAEPLAATDALTAAEWTPAAEWPPAEEEPVEESDSGFEWGAEYDSVAEADWAPSELVQAPEEAMPAEKPCPPPAAGVHVPLAASPAGEGAGRPLISAEDLRARIEESRRRIRQELDEPFVMPDRVTDVPVLPVVVPSVVTDEPVVVPPRVPEPPAEVSPSELEAPFVSPPRAPEPLAALIPPEVMAGPDVAAETWEEPSPTIEVQPADESLFAELGVRVDHTPSPGGESEDLRSRIESARQASESIFGPSPEELETSLSYDAMRARIEETRDRLKAKAMDARMPGGASEADGVSGAPTIRGSADTEAEIAARIDSILSEKNE